MLTAYQKLNGTWWPLALWTTLYAIMSVRFFPLNVLLILFTYNCASSQDSEDEIDDYKSAEEQQVNTQPDPTPTSGMPPGNPPAAAATTTTFREEVDVPPEVPPEVPAEPPTQQQQQQQYLGGQQGQGTMEARAPSPGGNLGGQAAMLSGPSSIGSNMIGCVWVEGEVYLIYFFF